TRFDGLGQVWRRSGSSLTAPFTARKKNRSRLARRRTKLEFECPNATDFPYHERQVNGKGPTREIPRVHKEFAVLSGGCYIPAIFDCYFADSSMVMQGLGPQHLWRCRG